MKDSSIDDAVIDTLEAALASEKIPAAARGHAEHLLRRLGSPVRVSVMGLPNSGKSELINMLVGRRLLPKNAKLPTTEVVYGDAERMTLTLGDGTTEVRDKLDLSRPLPVDAAFLKLELPARILQRISLLEVVTDGSPQDLAPAAAWAARRTDIALWCTLSFGGAEADAWNKVPDGLKDHAFLVLTNADVLSAERTLSKRIASLEGVVAEEFHSLFAVATLQAIKAQGEDGAVDEQLYQASGGAALAAEMLRHAERGRRADFDSAHMFLARFKIKPKATAKFEKEPKAQAEVTEPEETVADTPTPEAASDPASTPVQDDTLPVPEEPAAAEFVAETVESEEPENVELLRDAVRFLKRRGETLAEAASGLNEGDTQGLVDQCVDAVEYLVDRFSQDESGCPVADAMIDELTEAEDMMILMQVEDGDAPAADAATLLLQLRREMEMKLAA